MFDKWLPFNTKKPNLNPFANRKNVTQWLSELSAADIAGTLEQVIRALQDLRKQHGQIAETDRLEVVMAIDDYAQPLLHTLSTQYLRNSRMSSAMESKLWRGIYSYYNELSYAYHEAIDPELTRTDTTQPKAILQKISLRTLHSLGHVFKWRFIHYDLPGEELWQMLHNTYRYAEEGGFENELIPLYGSNGSRCSNQYMRALLLSQIHASSLLPKQIEMADIWILKWVHLVEIEKKPVPGRHHFCINLSRPAGVEPVTDQSFTDDCRAWDASTLLGQLRRTREVITTSKPNSTTESDARLPEYLKMLAYAELQWTPGNLGKLRKNPRVAANKILNVLHGFYIICTALKTADTANHEGGAYHSDSGIRYDEMIDIQLYGFVTESTRNRQQSAFSQPKKTNLPFENWMTENESKKGYLACSPPSDNNWLRLGCLAGVRVDQEQWKIAVVRRLFRDRDDNTHVGMEVFAQTPILLTLQPLQSLSTDVGTPVPDNGSIMAIMVSAPRNGHFSLIIDSVQYSRERQFKTVLEQKTLLVSLNRVLEKGDTWILAGASVVA